ncbi:MAG: AAA family ATPase, partial [Paracoccaceae bacterium]|nr:AAA family ATPase [Paracoccaceae bacterium]
MTTDPLLKIAEALERMAPAPLASPDFEAADAFVWHIEPERLEPVHNVSRVDLSLLIGVDASRDTLLE